MSSPPNASQDGEFHNRVERVADARAPYDAAKPYVSPLPDWKETVRYPVTLVVAVVVGMLAVLVSRLVRFQYLDGSLAGNNPDIAMIIDLAFAAGISFLLFAILRIDGAVVKLAQLFGIFVMFGAMHNLVHAAPTPFSAIFSEKWTSEVVANTKPNSILFRGESIVVYEPKPKRAAKPTVRRAGKT